MKVLFLDVDGVLNSRDTTNFHDLWPLDTYMAFLVGKIYLDTDCKIVMSSSWRNHPQGVETVEKCLGVKMLDKTGNSPLVNYDDKPRGHEIQEWLDNHSEVTKYAILDDDSDMLPEQLPNFFQTTFQSGLNETIARAVTEHLNAEAS